MTVKITISVDQQVKQSLSALARKHKRTVSGLISELIAKESRKEKILVSGAGLGSLLRSHNNILGEDAKKDYKELLREILEEKHHTGQ